MSGYSRRAAASAVALQRSALGVFTRVCGPDHPDTAQTLDKLGYALRLSGRADEAAGVHLRAVRLLEERGAFAFRKSAELVAEALGVSRFTVYNYLNRGRR